MCHFCYNKENISNVSWFGSENIFLPCCDECMEWYKALCDLVIKTFEAKDEFETYSGAKMLRSHKSNKRCEECESGEDVRGVTVSIPGYATFSSEYCKECVERSHVIKRDVYFADYLKKNTACDACYRMTRNSSLVEIPRPGKSAISVCENCAEEERKWAQPISVCNEEEEFVAGNGPRVCVGKKASGFDCPCESPYGTRKTMISIAGFTMVGQFCEICTQTPSDLADILRSRTKYGDPHDDNPFVRYHSVEIRSE